MTIIPNRNRPSPPRAWMTIKEISIAAITYRILGG